MSELKKSKMIMNLALGAALGLIVMLIPYALFHTGLEAEGWQKGVSPWPTYQPSRIDQETLKEVPTDRGDHAEKLVVTSITWADFIKIATIVTLGVVPALTVSIVIRRRVEV